MLVFDRVSKIYSNPKRGSTRALEDVSFELKPGDCCCLLGPNGAGKTTLLRTMLGFLPLTSGDIRVAGVSVREDAARARDHISYIPDEVALYRDMTGRQNLDFFARLSGARRDDYDVLAQRVGLREGALDLKLRDYSKGMAQRLAIGVALLKTAKVYALDEPTNGLDALGIRELIDILHRVRQDGGIVLVTTHDLMHVSALATRVLFLFGGVIRHAIEGDHIKTTDIEELYVDLVRREAEKS